LSNALVLSNLCETPAACHRNLLRYKCYYYQIRSFIPLKGVLKECPVVKGVTPQQISSDFELQGILSLFLFSPLLCRRLWFLQGIYPINLTSSFVLVMIVITAHLKGCPPPIFFLFLENATTLRRIFSVASYSVNTSHFVPTGFCPEAIQAEIEVPVT
jgi:hypothetical protein